ncbi:MAG: aminomethyl-transferring glycine dehydrogenase subunit GcvPA [Candidatus Berkiellales bacterium]
MPFIPHTPEDIAAMLADLKCQQIADLFAEIPSNLMIHSLSGIPSGLTEMEAAKLMHERAGAQNALRCFAGAGAYEHHIPAAVWDIAERGEFLTSYTPYQAEVNQGTLQLLWEYQTMISSLMGLHVSNASLYDGATSLAEAVLMALRLQTKVKEHAVWVPLTLHPYYRQVLATILSPHQIKMVDIPFDPNLGVLTAEILKHHTQQHPVCTVLILPQPNFLGQCEPVHELTNWGHEQGAFVIGVVNPLAMAWLKPPGQWGNKGADIACGEGQPLGVPLSGGGPYFGFLCSKKEFVRQLPGRIVGRTQDADGKEGFTLTLQAREQHIRRAKATSNICTNQGLMVTAATIYLSLMGPKGLNIIAKTCHQRAQTLIQHLEQIPGVTRLFKGSYFHEVAFTLPIDINVLLKEMKKQGIFAGVALDAFYSQFKNTLLICVTETKTEQDIIHYASALKKILG